MTMQPDDLKALRKAAGMTQDALAEAIGMSRKAINEMEGGSAPIERRTELAVRWVTSGPQAVGNQTAAGIYGQGQAATMNVDGIYKAMLPMLDKRYSRLAG